MYRWQMLLLFLTSVRQFLDIILDCCRGTFPVLPDMVLDSGSSEFLLQNPVENKRRHLLKYEFMDTATNQTPAFLSIVIESEPPVLRHCVAKISRRCHRIAVEILSGTGTNHATHKSILCTTSSIKDSDSYCLTAPCLVSSADCLAAGC